MAAQTSLTPVLIGDLEIQQFLTQIDSSPEEKKVSIFKPAAFADKLKSFIEFLDRGECYIFKEEDDLYFSPDRVFHKCTQDWDKPEFQKFDFSKNKVYIVADESSTDNYFDEVTYDRLQEKFEELGYLCKCQMYKQWPPKVDVDVLYLDQKFHQV